MTVSIQKIPFILNRKNGVIEVCYEENTSIHKSGFDLLVGLNFEPSMCIGYPTMHASIKNFDGTGYACSSAWIQIITDEFHDAADSEKPKITIVEADVSGQLLELGIPFFSYGYPSEIYDAPCSNLGEYKKLKWNADTFLVTYPSRMNDNTISYLAGFKWGYVESDIDGERSVVILPLKVTDKISWEKHLDFLKSSFDKWKFE